MAVPCNVVSYLRDKGQSRLELSSIPQKALVVTPLTRDERSQRLLCFCQGQKKNRPVPKRRASGLCPRLPI